MQDVNVLVLHVIYDCQGHLQDSQSSHEAKEAAIRILPEVSPYCGEDRLVRIHATILKSGILILVKNLPVQISWSHNATFHCTLKFNKRLNISVILELIWNLPNACVHDRGKMANTRIMRYKSYRSPKNC